MAGLITSDIEETPLFQTEADAYKRQRVPYITETGEFAERDFTVEDVFISASPAGDSLELQRYLTHQFAQNLEDGLISKQDLERQLNRTLTEADISALKDEEQNQINTQFIADYGRSPFQLRIVLLGLMALPPSGTVIKKHLC